MDAKKTNQTPQQQQPEKGGVLFQFSAPPPRFRFEQNASQEMMWDIAIHWVLENNQYIAWVAKKYLPFASSDPDDIRQQAFISAFEALQLCYKKNEPEARFNGYFFIRFKRSCLSMAAGPLQLPVGEDIGNLSANYSSDNTPVDILVKKEDERQKARFNGMLMSAALGAMSKKQRNAWQTFMDTEQAPGIAKADVTAGKLGVSRRETYLLLERGIKKVTKGIESGLIQRDEDSGTYFINEEFKKAAKRKKK